MRSVRCEGAENFLKASLSLQSVTTERFLFFFWTVSGHQPGHAFSAQAAWAKGLSRYLSLLRRSLTSRGIRTSLGHLHRTRQRSTTTQLQEVHVHYQAKVWTRFASDLVGFLSGLFT